MHWHNEPPEWTQNGATMRAVTGPKTDFWRKTHYGFIRDNGHFAFEPVAGDFVAEVRVSGAYAALYDQAGLMVRVDETTWMKCGIEFFEGQQHASVVVTRDYSDWSVVPLPENPAAIWLRVRRSGGDLEVHYSLDGERYYLLRVAHLAPADTLQVGPMCASPEGEGFAVAFESFTVRPHETTA